MPRLFTIPQSAPFLDSLARALLAGDLPVPGGGAPELRELPGYTVLLPTRRACRELRRSFLRVSGGKAALLPSIRPIGEVDEEAGFFEAPSLPPDQAELALTQPAAIGNLERQLVLTELVLKWREAIESASGAAPAFRDAPFPAATPAQASTLAARLVELMDSVEAEQADLSRLARIVPDRFAEHWRLTLEFLEIVTEHWPRYLDERGLTSPYARRNAVMAAEAARLAAAPDARVIAAGSTGSVPATSALLSVIAALPEGAVILPGLDLELDRESWARLLEHQPEHPQAGMAQLLERMGAVREDVAYLPGTAPDPPRSARLRMISETMRPAGSTDRWQQFREQVDRGALETALDGIALLEASTARDEAEAISLIMRREAEDASRRAALVTPDRTLARRVATRLKEWKLVVDDSAGQPLGATPPAVFLDLVAEVVHAGFAPVPLMALLKHPLCRMRRTAGAIRRAARLVELAAFRQPVAAIGPSETLRALRRARSARRGGARQHPALSRFRAEEWEEAEDVLGDLERAFEPLAGLYATARPRPLRDFVEAHAEVADGLARDERGLPTGLWGGDAGEALSLLLAQILTGVVGGPSLMPPDYAEFYRTLFQGQTVRPGISAHPRLHIWGPLEARLQQPDLVILAGLNEGTWPAPIEVDPWLSRPMRSEIGLPPPERRIGLSAHDFAQLLGAPGVVLTRATRVGGVPTVASRWLMRLGAVVDMTVGGEALKPKLPWLDWVRERDKAGPKKSIERPEPRPPVASRPRRLSVTRIEDWIANPYAIYAREILALVPLGQLAPEPDAALRGEIIHRVMHRFTQAHGEALPENCADELIRIAEDLLRELTGVARIAAFWRPQFVRFAHWFARTEPERRQGIRRVCPEVAGSLLLPSAGGDFRLTARADRIDETDAGGLVIYDYKTGAPPTPRYVGELFAPQLPLEAAIAARGGFDGVAGAAVADLRYVRITGREPAGEVRPAAPVSPTELADEALSQLSDLVARFDRQETAYLPLRRPRFESRYRYDDYAHLARVKEWSGDDGEAD